MERFGVLAMSRGAWIAIGISVAMIFFLVGLHVKRSGGKAD